MEILKDYSIEDDIIVIKKKKKRHEIHAATISSYWRKLCPEVVHDFIEFTTELIKEIMKETVDVAERWGVKGFKI